MPNFSLPASPRGAVAPRPPRSGVSIPWEHRHATSGDPDLGPLRRQAAGIIETVLSDTDPDEAGIRDKLRRRVAENPGQPEKALLSHLLSLSVEREAS